jgi:hypothetical protein
MQRTGGPRSPSENRALAAALATLALTLASAPTAGCGGETGIPDDGALVDRPIDSPFDPPIDAPAIDAAVPVDAPLDAAGCAASDFLLRGYYFDWDSTLANSIGIGGSRWSVVGDANRTSETQPSGLLSMCLPGGTTSQLTVTGPPGYLGGRFIADPAVLATPSTFIMRGLQQAMASAQYQEFLGAGDGFNSGRAHVLVYYFGAAIPLALEPALNPPQRSFVSGGNFNDITWTEGDTAKLTLFPNRPFGNGTATLTSSAAFTGPTQLPLVNGAFTIVVIRSN